MIHKNIYILGIAGTFTAQIAKLAKQMGYDVSGCDDNIYPPMSDQLIKNNIAVDNGYLLEHIKNKKDSQFIIGNVITRGNPILEFILNHRLAYLSASHWLKQNVLKNKKVIAISGTHGKTTTTALVAHILRVNSIDCGYLIGGNAKNFSTNADLGSSDYFVIEADEYDSCFCEKYPKFMHYQPDILLINNLEFDHGDIYANLKEIQKNFHFLLRTLPQNAVLIYPKNDKNIKQVLVQGLYCQALTWQKYHKNNSADLDYQLTDDKISFQLDFKNKKQTALIKRQKDIFNPLSSEFNIKNASAAILAAMQTGLSLSDCAYAIESFKGVDRRMELKYSNKNIKIFEDFAHHPSAIGLSLKALKSFFVGQKILSIFEPASNSLKMALHSDQSLKNAFLLSDSSYFYQPKKAKINMQLIAKELKNAYCFADTDQIVHFCLKNYAQFDIIVIFSNSSFAGLVPKLIAKIKNNEN